MLPAPTTGFTGRRLRPNRDPGRASLLTCFIRREIELHTLDLRPSRAQRIGCSPDAGILGDDKEIEAVLRELLGELEADAALRTGDDGELSGRFSKSGARRHERRPHRLRRENHSTIPRSMAARTAAVRLSTPSFSNTCTRCAFTVGSVIPNAAAICLFDAPRETDCGTSIS